jgi:hypothetical protein
MSIEVIAFFIRSVTVWCIHLHHYKLQVRLYPEFSIRNAIGYASVLDESSTGCRTETEAYSMSTSLDRATVNKHMTLFYYSSPLPLPFDLREATDVNFVLLQFPHQQCDFAFLFPRLII